MAAIKLFDLARVATSTTGTGTATLGAAETGFLTFADAGVADGEVVPYLIEDGNDREWGIGTYTASGTTLSRDTVTKSKISGTVGTSKISLSGSAKISIIARAADIATLQLELISTISLSSGSSKTLTSIAPYKAFVLAGDVSLSLAGGSVQIELSSNNGSSYGTALAITPNLSSGAVTYPFSAVVFGVGQSGVGKSVIAAGNGGLEASVTGLINALRLSPNAGNFDNGSVSIYGVR